MPFVQRNRNGEITGIFANPQDYAKEELPDDHPDVISFLEVFPIDPKLLMPSTSTEVEKNHKAYLRVEEEHKLIAIMGDLQPIYAGIDVSKHRITYPIT